MWYLENFAFLMWDFNDLWSLTGRIYKKTAKHVYKKKWMNLVICPLFELELHIILALQVNLACGWLLSFATPVFQIKNTQSDNTE